ncbi:hypothetical protein [Shewanella saliphila]|uniref:Uncharacterized protein n=1 Tax=Shewanella saliphila TaxID=2282698 RepID=A0ABQ2QB29_9GAMM|nr:hypothetical protein [Shewanella saliphila]MCL1103609.1 hypothetical protein [Shewanella saliphila]GGP71351.1 hypothetical protein GCM10009409_39360 [Shewanella saliphila]
MTIKGIAEYVGYAFLYTMLIFVMIQIVYSVSAPSSAFVSENDSFSTLLKLGFPHFIAVSIAAALIGLLIVKYTSENVMLISFFISLPISIITFLLSISNPEKVDGYFMVIGIKDSLIMFIMPAIAVSIMTKFKKNNIRVNI